MPPIFNQDDGQLVTGATISAVGQIRPWWDVNVSVQYLNSELESQNVVNNGNRLALTPEFSGSLWTTVRLPHDIRIGGGLRYTDAVFVNAANTIQVPGYTVADALVEAPLGTSDAAAEPLQHHRPRLHQEHQQQRRALQPWHAAGDSPDVGVSVLALAHAVTRSQRPDAADQVAHAPSGARSRRRGLTAASRQGRNRRARSRTCSCPRTRHTRESSAT